MTVYNLRGTDRSGRFLADGCEECLAMRQILAGRSFGKDCSCAVISADLGMRCTYVRRVAQLNYTDVMRIRERRCAGGRARSGLWLSGHGGNPQLQSLEFPVQH